MNAFSDMFLQVPRRPILVPRTGSRRVIRRWTGIPAIPYQYDCGGVVFVMRDTLNCHSSTTP